MSHALTFAEIERALDEAFIYNVQCNMGSHVFIAPKGSELEEHCIAREKRGILDALIIGTVECPFCIEENFEAEFRRQETDYYDEGDPF
jgi:hypothetical protein